MAVMDVVGREELVHVLDSEVGAESSLPVLTRRVANRLGSLIEAGRLRFSAELCRPLPDRYARRLLYRDPADRYTAVLMVWGPGQATPLHDHWGMWCVEAVVDGRIQVAQYRLLERSGDRFRFEPAGEVEAGQGSSGCLIPPFEYHTIANAVPGGTSVTLHVYGGEMTRCHAFEPLDPPTGGDGWFERQERPLSYTA